MNFRPSDCHSKGRQLSYHNSSNSLPNLQKKKKIVLSKISLYYSISIMIKPKLLNGPEDPVLWVHYLPFKLYLELFHLRSFYCNHNNPSVPWIYRVYSFLMAFTNAVFHFQEAFPNSPSLYWTSSLFISSWLKLPHGRFP